jgi:aspartyl-tRNA(Asn)/glutamyl-tRNA(Gln) amidotransferase subunit A
MSEVDLEQATIAEISPRIKKRQVSPVELTKICLDRIERFNPKLNAYLTVTGEKALADARKAEREIKRGVYRGPLHGIPFSIKDNITTQGVRTTAGSKILSEWVPDFDATVVHRLKKAGAVILGKTNMDEWALGGSTINAHYGPAHNPWDQSRIAGGSSGGSAAAVAAGMCMASIGTDSAQSTRNPAAICGVVGLKATYGRVSRFGGVAGTGGFSTDHFGIIAKTVEDSALVLQSVAGHDSRDPLSAEEPVPRYTGLLRERVKGLKAGIIKDYFDSIMVGEVKTAFWDAIKTVESLGVKIKEISIPHIELIPAIKNCTSRVENAAAHLPFLRTRPRDYSPQVLYSYIAALLTPGATYVTAQRVRRLVCEEFDEALNSVQTLLVPSFAHPTPTIEECGRGFMDVNGARIRLQDSRGSLNSLCTIPFNITGLPAISVCCGFSSSGMPMGLQVAAGAFQEGMVLRVAHAYERAAGWYQRRAPLT